MARFNIISNINNGAGLQREYEFLRKLLQSYGHTVTGVPHLSLDPVPQADVNIFDEVALPTAFDAAKENWLMPHCEWWSDGVWGHYIPRFSKILCKTRDCFDIWRNKMPPGILNALDRVIYTSFESSDTFDSRWPKQRAFLHVPGQSRSRQTNAVVDTWRDYMLPYPLTVITRVPEFEARCAGIPNITVLQHPSDNDLRYQMNTHQFIIAPSKYEGFGHLIHEALSVGAAVLTTDAPPMNQFKGIDRELLIKVDRRERWNAAWANIVSPVEVADAVHRAAGLSDAKLAEISKWAQIGFLEERQHFRDTFKKLMEGLC